jgi:hypothetical protein
MSGKQLEAAMSVAKSAELMGGKRASELGM